MDKLLLELNSDNNFQKFVKGGATAPRAHLAETLRVPNLRAPTFCPNRAAMSLRLAVLSLTVSAPVPGVLPCSPSLLPGAVLLSRPFGVVMCACAAGVTAGVTAPKVCVCYQEDD